MTTFDFVLLAIAIVAVAFALVAEYEAHQAEAELKSWKEQQ